MTTPDDGPRAEVQANGVIAVRGNLSYDTAGELLAATRGELETGRGAATVDLAQVAHVDSAGLALIVEWSRLARLAKRSLTLLNLPEQLQAMIRVHGLESTLGVDPQ